MTPLEVLAAARAAGVEVRLDGEDLIVSAASEPPAAVCAMLSQHKTAIVELLQAAGAEEEPCGRLPEIPLILDPPPITPARPATSAAAARREGAKVIALRQPAEDWSAEDWRGLYDERAGIAEFDGGLCRPEAEAKALEHCIAEWLYRHPVNSEADAGCLVCGDTDRPNDDLLPVGLGGGEVWLHRECSTTWRVARINTATAALAAMGIRK